MLANVGPNTSRIRSENPCGESGGLVRLIDADLGADFAERSGQRAIDSLWAMARDHGAFTTDVDERKWRSSPGRDLYRSGQAEPELLQALRDDSVRHTWSVFHLTIAESATNR